MLASDHYASGELKQKIDDVSDCLSLTIIPFSTTFFHLTVNALWRRDLLSDSTQRCAVGYQDIHQNLGPAKRSNFFGKSLEICL